mmetsp:Transcript_8795/g.13594  ORF Transcript_8795/g.13594 Transcript_8795/m.13594 type:complete len:685 (-) Transcript_8795:118-2172(-)
MAATSIWDIYIQQNGFAPKTAQQLLNFSKSMPDVTMTFKQANEIFEQHKTKPVVTHQKLVLSSAHSVPQKAHEIALPPQPSGPPPPAPSGSTQTPPENQATEPLILKNECQRQLDIFALERQNLNAIQHDFTDAYNAQIKDMDAQFTALMDVVQRRQTDLRNWRKQEYDEGMQCIERASQVIQQRLDELQSVSQQLMSVNASPNSVPQILQNIPKCDDFQLTRFTPQSLQTQSMINSVFMLGQTYQENAGNKTYISLRCNKTPPNTQQQQQPQDKRALDFTASPFGVGKIMAHPNAGSTPTNARANENVQNNGTQQLQLDQSAAGLRAFDTGNNAKYSTVQNMTPHTNVLPANFWEDNDTDSEEERRETQEQIVRRWKQQKSNIQYGGGGKHKRKKKQPNKPLPGSSALSAEHHAAVRRNTALTQTPNAQYALQPKTGSGGGHHKRARSVYDKSSSDEDENGDDDEEDDGFEKYVPPPPSQSEIAAAKEQKRREEEEYWKHNDTVWIVQESGKQYEYDSVFFGIPKMRNGKANGLQMKSFMEKSGLSKEVLKQIWKLSDLDKDGKMGNEEFALCMLLMEKAKNGEAIPDSLPKNYIPPSFRGKQLVKTPPKKARALTTVNTPPPNMKLNDPSATAVADQNVSASGFVITPKPKTRLSSKTTVSVTDISDIQISIRPKVTNVQNG